MRGKIHIDTYGCTANKSDSHIMAGLLKNAGFEITSLPEAEYVIVNSCGVKSRTEEKIMHKIEELSHTNKKLIVAGCLTKINPDRIKRTIPNLSAMLDTKSVDKIVDIVSEIERGKSGVVVLSKSSQDKTMLPKFSPNQAVAIIQVSEGCLSSCNFCATKLARGNLKSYRIGNIKREFKQAVKEGCKKIYLTGQDLGCYGFDINTDIVELVNELVTVKGNYKIRIGMMNPWHAIKILDKLIEAYKNPKVMKFVHIPVQSGSDIILKHMKRIHTVETFKTIVRRFRKEIPNITIATDIIIGYPLEKESNFIKTLDLIREIKPEVLNISKFSSRPKTYAAKLKPLPSQEVKKRSVIITKLYKEIKNKN